MTASTTAVPSTVSASTGKSGSATTKLSRTLGAALVGGVFGADNSFAENEKFNVSGDLCLHLDTSASALRAVRA